jgi:hypothetical protein
MLNVLPSRANGQGDRFRAKGFPGANRADESRGSPYTPGEFHGFCGSSRLVSLEGNLCDKREELARFVRRWPRNVVNSALLLRCATDATDWKPASWSRVQKNRLRERLLRIQHSAMRLARLRWARPYTTERIAKTRCIQPLLTVAQQGLPPLDATYARRIRSLLYRPPLPPLAIRSRRPGA